MRRAGAVALLLLGVAGRDAAAGRRFTTWVWDTDVLPERAVELEWWVWEKTGYAAREAALSAAGVVGLTDNLELALPVDVVWRPEAGTQLASAGVDLRWRLAPADRARSGPLVPLVRVGARRLFAEDAARLEGDAVLSLDAGRLHAVVDAGAIWISDDEEGYVTLGGGATVETITDLRFGVEAYGEIALDGASDETWVSVGPNVSFTHGRFWVSASLPIGIGDGPELLPRVIWAVAF